MTLSFAGRQYICLNFGCTSFCCINTGLDWYYTINGTNYPETGGTAQIVSRLASGLVDSLTMTNPARGTFTQAELNTANGEPVTLQDALLITDHDEPTEDQWCYIYCSDWTTKTDCENAGCHWFNGACHDYLPNCEDYNNQDECIADGCYWYNNSCHESLVCSAITTKSDCEANTCFWWNNECHDSLPATCGMIDNQQDCIDYGCYWYTNSCHSSEQPELCYWIDAKGGPTALAITDVFELIDSYLFQIPPSGYGFIPTLQEIFGVMDYYLGFNGDVATGCTYY